MRRVKEKPAGRYDFPAGRGSRIVGRCVAGRGVPRFRLRSVIRYRFVLAYEAQVELPVPFDRPSLGDVAWDEQLKYVNAGRSLVTAGKDQAGHQQVLIRVRPASLVTP